MLHYAVYMVPPAILTAVVFIENFKNIIRNNRVTGILIICIVAMIVWSFSLDLRQDLKLLFTNYILSFESFAFISSIIILFAVVLILPGSIIKKYTSNYLIHIFYILSSVLLINIIVLNSYYRLGHSYGAEKAAGFVLNSNDNSFVYLYNEATAADSLNPQLAWYTKGIMNHWIKGKTYKPYPLPFNQKLSEVLEDMKSLKENIVIYYKPREKEFAEIVYKNVSKEWKITEFCDRYIIFRKKY